MRIQFSLGNGLLRAAVSLGFIGCLVGQETFCFQAAASQPLIVTSEAVADTSVATPSFCGGRFTNLDNAYVPPPRVVFAGSTYDGDSLRFDCSDSMLTEPAEIGLPDEFGVAFEEKDSVEMFRVDIYQRAFGIDRVVIGLKIASKAVRNTGPNISPPLLV